MLLYLDDRFAEHDTGHHPENKARIIGVNEMLRDASWFESCTRPSWAAATGESLAEVHDADYLQQLRMWCEQNAGSIEADSVFSVLMGDQVEPRRGICGAKCT